MDTEQRALELHELAADSLGTEPAGAVLVALIAEKRRQIGALDQAIERSKRADIETEHGKEKNDASDS
jgi:hypothetical protein